MKKTIFLFSLLLLLNGCAKKPIDYTGDEAVLTLKNSDEIDIEIIAVNDSSLVFCRTERGAPVSYILLHDIESVSIDGYAGDNWVAPVILGQCVPAILMGVAAASAETESPAVIAVACAVPAVISIIIFSSTDGDTPGWVNTGDNNLTYLRKFARYPDGLNEARLNWLLKSRGQNSLARVP